MNLLLCGLHLMVMVQFLLIIKASPVCCYSRGDKSTSTRKYPFSMVLYCIPFSIGFYYMNFFTVCINYKSTSSCLVCISMVLVLFLIFLSRLPQYASISKMINGALFMSILFRYYVVPLYSDFLKHVYPFVQLPYVVVVLIYLVLFKEFYIKLLLLLFEFYIRLLFSRQKLFSLSKFWLQNSVLL